MNDSSEGAIPIQSVMEERGFGQGMEETVEEDVCLCCYHRNADYFSSGLIFATYCSTCSCGP